MQQEGMDDEDEDSDQEDRPPVKKLRTGKLCLDSDEAAFASTMRPIRSTPAAMSQYRNMDIESENDDGPVASGQQSDESDQGDADADMADSNANAEDDLNNVGFQDNGVCIHLFTSVMNLLLYMFRCRSSLATIICP